MKFGDINNKIKLAETYRYVASLELEKQKRQRHDFTDFDDFYKKKIEQYDHTLSRLHSLRRKRINNMFKVSAVGVHLILIAAFVLINLK